MPQLDISSYFSQLFWLFITFGILLFFISKYFLPAFNIMIADRRSFISSNQENIRGMEVKIEEIRQNHAKVIDDAKFAAQNIIADENVALAKLHDSTIVKLSDSVRAMYEENDKKMQSFLDGINSDIEKLCFDLTVKYHAVLFDKSLSGKQVNVSDAMAIIHQQVQQVIHQNR